MNSKILPIKELMGLSHTLLTDRYYSYEHFNKPWGWMVNAATKNLDFSNIYPQPIPEYAALPGIITRDI